MDHSVDEREDSHVLFCLNCWRAPQRLRPKVYETQMEMQIVFFAFLVLRNIKM